MAQREAGDYEDDLADLRKRFHLLEGDRKAYYETSQWLIRTNKETVENVRNENKILREKLSEFRKETNQVSSNQELKAEIQKLEKDVAAIRQRYDQVHSKNQAKEQQLQAGQDRLREFQLEAEKSEGGDDPHSTKIRSLENRLDKAMIKYNEAMSIRKTYEQIVKRLEAERLTFDNQLATAESALKAKGHDYDELLRMSRDAAHAKEVAKAELARLEQQLEDQRKAKERELVERRQVVQAKIEMNERMEKRLKNRQDVQADRERDEDGSARGAGRSANNDSKADEENEKKITSYEEAFRKIKDATGVSDVNEVIQKFLTQEDTHNNLLSLKQEAQHRIDQLNEEKTRQKAKAEEMKYSGSSVVGNRRVVDEYEAHLGEANARCERNRQRYERLAKILINVKAGVEHLADKLRHIQLDFANVAMSDETVVDVLFQAEQKIVKLMEELATGDGEANPDHGKTELDAPVSNIRIRLPHGDGEEGEGASASDESEEDDLMDRQAMKKRSEQVLEQSARKPKKGGRIGDKQAAPSGKRGSGGAVGMPSPSPAVASPGPRGGKSINTRRELE